DGVVDGGEAGLDLALGVADDVALVVAGGGGLGDGLYLLPVDGQGVEGLQGGAGGVLDAGERVVEVGGVLRLVFLGEVFLYRRVHGASLGIWFWLGPGNS